MSPKTRASNSSVCAAPKRTPPRPPENTASQSPEDFGGNNFGKEKEEEADHKKDDDDDEREQHKKKKTWIPYGTAGFRCDETAMDPIAFRCGFIANVVAAFSSKSRKRTQASGVVVTASHNHAKDNGVKLVDGEGNVLGERYERRVRGAV